MQKHVLMLTTSAFVLACSSIAANAQQPPGVPMTQQPGQQQTQQQPTGQEDSSMMGPGGMMDRGMMGPGGMMGRGMMGPGGMMGRGMMGRGMMAQEGMMGRRTMGPPVMMRMIFSLMDSDGDGTISLQEFQAAHERILGWTPTKMADSLRRRCRPSCRERGDRFRGSRASPDSVDPFTG